MNGSRVDSHVISRHSARSYLRSRERRVFDVDEDDGGRCVAIVRSSRTDDEETQASLRLFPNSLLPSFDIVGPNWHSLTPLYALS